MGKDENSDYTKCWWRSIENRHVLLRVKTLVICPNRIYTGGKDGNLFVSYNIHIFIHCKPAVLLLET